MYERNPSKLYQEDDILIRKVKSSQVKILIYSR